MKKGFVISITTLYFVMLFIVFLSIVIFKIQNPVYNDAQTIQSINQNPNFVSNTSNIIISPNTNETWCSDYYFYNANENKSGYNTFNKKKYCVSYDGKRFV